MTTPVTFLKEAKDELKKVTWPKRNDVTRLTFLVIAVSVIVGLYIGGLDYALIEIMRLILKKG